jgi:thioredoxin-related protein
MNSIRSLIFIVLVSFPLYSKAQLQRVTFEELDSLQLLEPRSVAVFVHTDWCKFCQAMLSVSFENAEVQNILNQSFYFIELNGECKDDIRFQNHVFSFKPSGNGAGVHELAEQLAFIIDHISYPTFCVLNSEYEIAFQFAQFMSANSLIEVLNRLSAQ